MIHVRQNTVCTVKCPFNECKQIYRTLDASKQHAADTADHKTHLCMKDDCFYTTLVNSNDCNLKLVVHYQYCVSISCLFCAGVLNIAIF